MKTKRTKESKAEIKAYALKRIMDAAHECANIKRFLVERVGVKAAVCATNAEAALLLAAVEVEAIK